VASSQYTPPTELKI